MATLTIDTETDEALADVVAEFGGNKEDHVKARALEMRASAVQSFDNRVVRAARYMKANPTEGYGPQGAKWAQVRAALLAAEVALLAEQAEE